MKKALLFLSVATFILITSCEKDAKEELSSLAIDLQNGYWETHFTSGAISVMKFNESTATFYWIEGTPPCILEANTRDYTLDGNILTMPTENSLMIEIEGDVLTLTDEVDQMMIEFNRKSILDYTDC